MPSNSRTAATSSALFCVLLLFGFTDARAQDASLDVQQFKPALDMHGFVLLYDGDTLPARRLGASVHVHGALHPFEVHTTGVGRQFGVMDHLVGVDLGVAFGVTDRLEVGAAFPVAQVPITTGFLEELGAEARPVVPGDLRLEVRVRPPVPDGPASITAGLFTSLPTGGARALLGRGLPGFGGRIAVGVIGGRVFMAANVGFALHAESTLANITTGPEFTYGVGVGASPVLGRLDFTAELDGSLTAGPSAAGVERLGDPAHSPLELLVGARVMLPHGFSVYVGGGTGVTPGFGSPRVRVVTRVQWALRTPIDRDGDGVLNPDDVCPADAEDVDGFEDGDGCPDPDDDGDTIFDDVDLCPRVGEDLDGFEDDDGCPDPDDDQDGVFDTRDACPRQPEDLDGFEDADGCPDLDDDGDGVYDVGDACPREPEDVDGFEDLDGCPEPDNDQDGVPDLLDFCPESPEALDGVRDEDGCPDDMLAVVAEDRLLVFGNLGFDRRGRLKQDPEGLLEEIAGLIVARGLGVRIEVHTDGSLGAGGLQASSERAATLRDRLIELGVDAARLDAVGFGALRPAYEGAEPTSRIELLRVR